jgi:hypothetical protein
MKLKAALILTIALLTLLAPVHAGDGRRVRFTVGCTGFTSQGGELLLNRDNTGAGREAFVVTAFDGAGNTILEPRLDSFFVGGTVAWQNGEFFAWTSRPRYNPVSLQITSAEGHGQGIQVIYTVTGICQGLPSYASQLLDSGGRLITSFVSAILPATGETGPALPVNTVPPRPINPPGLAESQSGYLVVATDNLYLRTGPGIEYAPIGIVDGGTFLVALGFNDADLPANNDAFWWYVQVGGTRGWVKGTLVIIRGNLSGLGEVPVIGVPYTPTVAIGFTGNPIFATPRLSTRLCTLPGGLEHRIVGRNQAATLWQIETTCENGQQVTGWIPAEYGLLRNLGGVDIPVTG